MHDLKTYRNSIASISLLPDELLAQIFAQYRLIEQGGPWMPTWCKILHVCKRWKSCALATSQLWTCIGNAQYSTRGQFGRMLDWHSLSKGYPLQFQFYLSTHSPETDYFFAFLERTPVDQIVFLGLSGTRTELQSFLAHAVPFISARDVSLDCLYKSSEDSTFTFPEHLFNLNTLRSLELVAVPFSSASTFLRLSNLTRFRYIRGVGEQDFEHLQLNDLLLVLQQCPQLTCLELSLAVEFTTPLTVSIATLSMLEELILATSTPIASELLRRLQMPAPVSIELSLFRDLSMIENVWQEIGVHLRRPGSPIFRSMFFDRAGIKEVCSLGLFGAESAPTGSGGGFDCIQGPRICLTFSAFSRAHQYHELRQLFHEIPLHHIRQVNATGNGPSGRGLSRRAWRTFFTFLPGPVSISIRLDEAVPDILDGYMDTFLSSPRSAAGGRRRYRSLRKSHPVISELKLLPFPSGLVEEEPSPGPQVLEFLQRYKDLGSPYKPFGKRFETVNLVRAEEHYVEIFPLVDRLIVHGLHYDPEEWKRNRIQNAWTCVYVLSIPIASETEELLKENMHHLDENGKWIRPLKLESTKSADKGVKLLGSWQMFGDYESFRDEDFTGLFF